MMSIHSSDSFLSDFQWQLSDSCMQLLGRSSDAQVGIGLCDKERACMCR